MIFFHRPPEQNLSAPCYTCAIHLIAIAAPGGFP